MNCARILSAILAVICVAVPSFATPPPIQPEDGYISQSLYLNRYFGLVLPIPKQLNLFPAPVPEVQGNTRWLLSLRAKTDAHAVVVTVWATPPPKHGGIPADLQSDFPDAYSGTGGPTRVDIGGQRFWKITVPPSAQADVPNAVEYGAVVRDYLLKIRITKVGEIPAAFTRFVESAVFVPSGEIEGKRTAEMVKYSGPALPELGRPTPAIARLESGTTVGNEYRNDMLGIAYRIPAGLQARPFENPSKSSPIEQQVAVTCTRPLFFADDGKRPNGGHSNVALTITAMDPACLQGAYFPTSLSDTAALQTLAEVLASRIPSGRPGLKMDGRVQRVGDHLFVILSGIFYETEPGTGLKIPNRMRLIATESNGYVVTWTFLAPDRESLESAASGSVRFYTAENESGAAEPTSGADAR